MAVVVQAAAQVTATHPIIVVGLGLLGLAVGSFLNVVIYRLPRGLSISRPRRSFCPACGQSLSAGDNVPVVSWLLLRGRCRRCRASIGVVYPVIELLCALTLLMTWDALMIGRVVRPFGQLPGDVPVVLAYAVLFAGLLASSAMDVEEYLIDVRVTHFVCAVGIVARSAWGAWQPERAIGGASPRAGIIAAGVLVGAMGWYAIGWLRKGRAEPASLEGDEPHRDPTPSFAHTTATLEIAVVLLMVAAVTGLGVAMVLDAGRSDLALLPRSSQRAIGGVFMLLVALLMASMVPREADVAMESAIVSEQPRARGMVLNELAGLFPALLVGTLALVALGASGHAAMAWVAPGSSPTSAVGALAGAAAAVSGLVWAAGIGWFVRIFFTLVLGKEAYGVGDIYLMAAIGAVGGVWLTLISFFLGAILALIGVLATSVRKSSRALPFGPWLALGALAGLWVHDPLVAYVRQAVAGARLLAGEG